MPRRPSPLSLACCISTSLTLFLLAAVPARAQDQRKGILPADGEAKFMKEYSAARENVFKNINRPLEGEKANKDNAAHKAAIDLSAQYFTYRLTWDKYADPGEVDKLMSAFFSEVLTANGDTMRKANPAFSEMFLSALAVRARAVVQTSKPIAAVNAARMLARLAETGSDEAGEACWEAVKNTNDFLEPKARLGVQYWAFKGLGSLLFRWADPPLNPDGTPAPVPADRKEREAKYVEALTATIDKFAAADGKSSAGVAPDSPEELGLQMFRREAVRALAQYRKPAVADDKGAIKVKSALTLLKVANGDGLSPKARLDEQIDAAWGLARIRSKGLASYQPDYAAQQIGYVVVQMAANARSRVENKDKIPWKYHAARLSDALELMRDDAKGLPDKAGAAYVDKMVTQALLILKDIESKEQSTGGGALSLWLGSNPAPHNTLYKGVADSTVRPLDKSDAPPEKPVKEEKKPGDKKPAKP